MIKRSGSLLPATVKPEQAKVVSDAALANLASKLLWTPAAGKRIYPQKITLFTSAVGVLTLVGSTFGTFWEMNLQAAICFEIDFTDQGLNILVPNETISCVNNTGGVIVFRSVSYGYER